MFAPEARYTLRQVRRRVAFGGVAAVLVLLAVTLASRPAPPALPPRPDPEVLRALARQAFDAGEFYRAYRMWLDADATSAAPDAATSAAPNAATDSAAAGAGAPGSRADPEAPDFAPGAQRRVPGWVLYAGYRAGQAELPEAYFRDYRPLLRRAVDQPWPGLPERVRAGARKLLAHDRYAYAVARALVTPGLSASVTRLTGPLPENPRAAVAAVCAALRDFVAIVPELTPQAATFPLDTLLRGYGALDDVAWLMGAALQATLPEVAAVWLVTPAPAPATRDALLLPALGEALGGAPLGASSLPRLLLIGLRDAGAASAPGARNAVANTPGTRDTEPRSGGRAPQSLVWLGFDVYAGVPLLDGRDSDAGAQGTRRWLELGDWLAQPERLWAPIAERLAYGRDPARVFGPAARFVFVTGHPFLGAVVDQRERGRSAVARLALGALGAWLAQVFAELGPHPFFAIRAPAPFPTFGLDAAWRTGTRLPQRSPVMPRAGAALAATRQGSYLPKLLGTEFPPNYAKALGTPPGNPENFWLRYRALRRGRLEEALNAFDESTWKQYTLGNWEAARRRLGPGAFVQGAASWFAGGLGSTLVPFAAVGPGVVESATTGLVAARAALQKAELLILLGSPEAALDALAAFLDADRAYAEASQPALSRALARHARFLLARLTRSPRKPARGSAAGANVPDDRADERDARRRATAASAASDAPAPLGVAERLAEWLRPLPLGVGEAPGAP